MIYFHCIFCFPLCPLLQTFSIVYFRPTDVFYPSQDEFQFFNHLILSSANAFNLDQFKIMLFGKELNVALLFTTQSQL